MVDRPVRRKQVTGDQRHDTITRVDLRLIDCDGRLFMAKTSAWMIVPNLLRTLMRGDVPLKSKLILLAGLVYLISPVDLLPDVIVGFGWFDDLVIVPLLGWLSYRSLPAPVQHDVVPAADASAGQNTSRRTVLYMVVLLVAVVLVILLGSGDGELELTPVSPVLSQ